MRLPFASAWRSFRSSEGTGMSLSHCVFASSLTRFCVSLYLAGRVISVSWCVRILKRLETPKSPWCVLQIKPKISTRESIGPSPLVSKATLDRLHRNYSLYDVFTDCREAGKDTLEVLNALGLDLKAEVENGRFKRVLHNSMDAWPWERLKASDEKIRCYKSVRSFLVTPALTHDH